MMKKKMLKLTKVTLAGGLIISSIGLTGLESQAAKQKIVVAKKSAVVVKKNKLLNKKTGKRTKKYVLYQSKLYKNGVLFTGVVNGVKYAKGKKLNGVVKNIYYKAGKKASGTAKNGKYYYKGVLAKGLVANKYYVNGKKGTGIAKNGKLYVKGVLNKGAYYYTTTKKWYAGAYLDVAKNKAVANYLAAKNLSKSQYTTDSWEIFVSLVAANEVSTTSKAITVTQLNAATEALKKAKDELILKSTTAAEEVEILAVRKALAALSAKSTLEEILAVESLYNKLSAINRTQISLQLVRNLEGFKKKAEDEVSSPEKELAAANKKITDAIAKMGDLDFGSDEEITVAAVKAKLPVIDGIKYTVEQIGDSKNWSITIQDSAGKGAVQKKVITVTLKEETAEQLANKLITEAVDQIVDLSFTASEKITADLINSKLPVIDGVIYKVKQLGTSNDWEITIQDSANKGTAQIKTIKVTVKASTPEEVADALIEETLEQLENVKVGFTEVVTVDLVKSKLPVVDGITYTVQRVGTSDTWVITVQDTLGKGKAKTKNIMTVKNDKTDVELANENIEKALEKVGNLDFGYDEEVTAATIKVKLPVIPGITYTVLATSTTNKWKVKIQDDAAKGTEKEKEITVKINEATGPQLANKNITDAINALGNVELDYGVTANSAVIVEAIKSKPQVNTSISYEVSYSGSGNNWVVTVQDNQKLGKAQTKTITVTVKAPTDTQLANEAITAAIAAINRLGGIKLSQSESMDGETIKSKLPKNDKVTYSVSGSGSSWTVTVQDKLGKGTAQSTAITVTKTEKTDSELANDDITAALNEIGNITIEYGEEVDAETIKSKLPRNDKVTYSVSGSGSNWTVTVQDIGKKGSSQSKGITVTVKAPTEAQTANEAITRAIGKVGNIVLEVGKTANEMEIVAKLTKETGMKYTATQTSTAGKWIISVRDEAGKGTAQMKEITVTVLKSSDTTLAPLTNVTIGASSITIPAKQTVLVANVKANYPQATVTVKTEAGVPRIIGELLNGDSITVTAEDGTTKNYFVNKIASSDTRVNLPAGTLVTTSSYKNTFEISSGQAVSIASLKGMDAKTIVKVTNKKGDEIKTGNLADNYNVLVIAEDGTTKSYEVGFVVGLIGIPLNLRVMPDTGLVYVGGIEITIALTTTVKVETLRPVVSGTKITVFDRNGNVKTSGNLTKEDTIFTETEDGKSYAYFSVKDQNNR